MTGLRSSAPNATRFTEIPRASRPRVCDTRPTPAPKAREAWATACESPGWPRSDLPLQEEAQSSSGSSRLRSGSASSAPRHRTPSSILDRHQRPGRPSSSRPSFLLDDHRSVLTRSALNRALHRSWKAVISVIRGPPLPRNRLPLASRTRSLVASGFVAGAGATLRGPRKVSASSVTGQPSVREAS